MQGETDGIRLDRAPAPNRRAPACAAPPEGAGRLSLPHDIGPADRDPVRSARPFRYVHTDGFSHLLSRLGVSLVVSTYQAGKLVLIRSEGDRCSVSLRNFPHPMGIAVAPDRMALGTSTQVWTFRSEPQIAPQLEPAGRHDGCFVPRSAHVTGDIRVHEVAYVGGELWLVNTRFSCLCAVEPDYSFVPRWRPSFVSALVAEDRCHLNGLAVVGDQVRYVTALGETDARSDWRSNRGSGGILIDVPSGEVVARGLSMPHSPRVYDGKVWVLNSGQGALCTVDPSDGRCRTVCRLPGFTRGVSFHDRFAFVGLSKIREKRAFGGLPLEDRPGDLECAVYAVDIDTGRVPGFLRFEAGSEELFDVQVLPDLRWPAIIGTRREPMKGIFVLPRSEVDRPRAPDRA